MDFLVGLALVIGVVPLAIGGTVRGLQYGLLLVLFTGLVRITLLNGIGGLPVILLDRLVWPILLLIFLLKRKRGEIDRLSLDWIEYAFLILMVVICISMYSADTYIRSEGREGSLKLRPFLNGFLYPFMGYFIARRAIQTDKQVRQFLIGAGLITVYLIVSGLGEALNQHWLVFPKFILDPDKGIHQNFVRGPLLNAGFNGLAIAMGLPTLLWGFFSDRGLRSWMWLVAFVLAAVPLTFSFQRSAWLATALVLAALAMAWPKRRVVMIGGLALAVSIGLLALSGTQAEEKLTGRLQDQNTIDFRYQMAEKSLIVIRENPVRGVGFYRFSEAVSEISKGSDISHNTFLSIFAELGLLGFLPYLSIFFFLFFVSVKGYFQQARNRPLLFIFSGIAMAYLETALTSNVMNAPYLNTFFFILLGIILRQVRKPSTFQKISEMVRRPVTSFV